MAAFIESSNVQTEAIQTLHLMNPSYSACPEAASISANESGYSVQGQPPALQAIYTPQQSPSGPFSTRMSPYIWTNSTTTTNEVPFASSSEATPLSHAVASRYTSTITPESQYSQFSIGRPQAMQEGAAALGSNVAHTLSLSLSPRHNPVQIPYYDNVQTDTLQGIPDLTYVVGDKRGDRLLNTGYVPHLKGSENEALGSTLHNYMTDMSGRHSYAHASAQPEVSSVGGFFAQSKYLRAIQHLLNEVVSVEDAIKKSLHQMKHSKMASWGTHPSVGDVSGSLKAMAGEMGVAAREGVSWSLSIAKSVSCPDLATSTIAVELTPQARQELQLKKAKLMAMLEEVDRRYKLYRSQMQVIVNLFESAAGPGAARCYTALALQTISRHFRCLRDAIAGQVRAAGKGLGEEEHLSQQRALQHLHMMHQHAWRPQRGLPERAVSVLRAWLFEHFLHPYPKDADKVMLAKQTGLTRNQVSNWFINARVRLWKPMVEEMYQEEAKDDDTISTQGLNDTDKEGDELRAASAAQRDSHRGVDPSFLGNISADQPEQEGAEKGTHLHRFSTAVMSQSALVEVSAAEDASFSLHDWQGTKKARNLEGFAGRGDTYPAAIKAEEERQSFLAMQGIDTQSYNTFLSNAGPTRGSMSGVLGSGTVSLTLGLQQHRDPMEAQSQHQHQHLFFQHMQAPGYAHGQGVLQHIPQELPEGLLERVNTGDIATSQNYLASMAGTNFELLSQIHSQKQPYGHSLHPDYTS